MNLRIQYFFTFVSRGLLLALIFHIGMYLIGYPFPWTTFLFMPSDRFNDWHNSVAVAATFDPYFTAGNAVSAYFPFAYQVFLIGSGFSRGASTAIYLFVSIGLLVIAVGLSVKYMYPRRSPVEVVSTFHPTLILGCLCTYPVLFALDRGNLDIWISSLCIIYVACFNSPYRWVGMLALIFAISLKGYPLAFLGLACSKRRYREVLLCVVGSFLVTLAALAVMPGGVMHNVQGLLLGLQRYRMLYVLGDASMFASSDPYNGIRTMMAFMGESRNEAAQWSAGLLQVYVFVSFTFALIGGLFVALVPGPYWKRVVTVGLIAIIFPNVANDYKLTLLLPGLFALLLAQDSENYSGRSALLLLLLLLIPKSYFYMDGIGITNILNPMLLLTLSAVIWSDGSAWIRAYQNKRRCIGRVAKRRYGTKSLP